MFDHHDLHSMLNMESVGGGCLGSGTQFGVQLKQRYPCHIIYELVYVYRPVKWMAFIRCILIKNH